MHITQNNNSAQFRGAFLINYKQASYGGATHSLRYGFEKVIGKHKRQIFDSFNGKDGHTMYVLKNSKDYDAANYIIRNKLNFKYYPDIDTKLCFEPDKPEDVLNYIKIAHPKIIRSSDKLREYIINFREKFRQKPDSHLSAVDKILAALKFDKNSGQKVKTSNGVTTFADGDSANKVIVSPRSALGSRFVCVNPNNSYEPIRRYAFDEKGNQLAVFNPPDGIIKFNEEFKKAVKHHLHIDK